MLDYFDWRTRVLDAETLYFYVTLARSVYQHDSALWGTLVANIPQLTTTFDHPNVGTFQPGFTTVVGKTGTVVVVEGTYNFPFLLTQIATFEQEARAPYPGKVIKLHATIADAIWPAVAADLLTHATEPITFCGHSAGGSVALLLAHRLKQETSLALEGVISFGANKSGNDVFANATSFRVVRITNEGDWVPDLPPGAWAEVRRAGSLLNILTVNFWLHAGSWYHVSRRGAIVIGVGTTETGGYPPPKIISQPYGNVPIAKDHDAVEYARRLRFRLISNTPLPMMQAHNLAALDTVNFDMNATLGFDWHININNGFPISWEVPPNTPAPGPVSFASPDP
jgi:pimeloyl-ACP methyl ester carboxylesterase